MIIREPLRRHDAPLVRPFFDLDRSDISSVDGKNAEETAFFRLEYEAGFLCRAIELSPAVIVVT